MGIEIIYLIKALVFGLAAIVLIPKKLYKKFFIYGFFLGGMGNFFMVFVTGKILQIHQYKQLGVFNLFNMISFWTPIAWMFALMIFLYFLPTRKIFLYLYVPGYGFFGYCLGLVLQNFGLFEYKGIYLYIAPLLLIGWFALSAWAYIWAEKIVLEDS